MPAVTTIYDVIADIRARYDDNRARGDAFERLTQQYLLIDPLYAGRFTKVSLWQEWDGRDGKVDTGIDLVAETADGGYCAVQCKFYDPHHPVTKEDIDTFLSASGKKPFTERLVVSTTDVWSKHAEDAIADQHVPVARIGLADLSASTVDWSTFKSEKPAAPLKLAPKKKLRPHQKAALEAVFDGWEMSNRGKLIMACGTGKTFTSLKIAEEIAARSDGAALVLFLVPSISLVNQSLREWTAETALKIRSFAVCSDKKVGKQSATEDIRAHDLAIPATTDAAELVDALAGESDADLTIVFSTYQSIDAVADAQKAGVGEFDAVFCDEAHRTTGVTLADGDDSAFVRVHDAAFIKAKRRLYMTATPRLFNDDTKAKAAEADAVLCSMDDEQVYGPEFHRLSFGDAVKADLLTDYKVIVLNVDEEHVSATFQAQFADDNLELNLEDAARIVGCWNGLAKKGQHIGGDGFGTDPAPMRRAVAFSRSIKDSKAVTAKFAAVVSQYTAGSDGDSLAVEVQHVDGTDNALVRKERLAWLEAEPPANTCRILSNARCLSEGVDVPDLDAVLFLNPRNSQVDVVQSVGRVMRKADGKKYGYIILPVAIPGGIDPAEALKDNKRYKVVWQVLQALRAHDDRFNAMVNHIELNKAQPSQIEVIGVPGFGGGSDDKEYAPEAANAKPVQGFLKLGEQEWRDAIYGRIVDKVGERKYWEKWADDVRIIAERHVARIATAIEEPTAAAYFAEFLAELRSNLNPGVSKQAAIDMLAQHLITKPVFDALFGSYEFSEHNPVSKSMSDMLVYLGDNNIDEETRTLEAFYQQVRDKAAGVDNHEGRQRVVTELYEQFFRKALPKTADAFGIVYTPIEVVDFIVRAVNDALAEHFDTTISAPSVQILDPFTGTGTFIVRLLQSGLIKKKDLLRKYTSELHANEILLLAYYIAAVNIEATFDQLDGKTGDNYTPFEGIVLTDTFQLAETDDTIDPVVFPVNSERVRRQKQQDIRVIIGNPPYSVGQTSQNDDNQNQAYPALDTRLRDTYVATSKSKNRGSLYDPYVRAFRWATDRIQDTGVVCFVTNGGWLTNNSFDGFRKALVTEYDHIYVFNLRGNQRQAGEDSKREGGKIFGGGSRTTVAIALLVRSKEKSGCTIRYSDIGDYLSREEKLAIVSGADLGSLEWETLAPNDDGDWLALRAEDSAWINAPTVAGKNEPSVFDSNAPGVKTQRDSWCWNFSRQRVLETTSQLVQNYLHELERLKKNPDADLDRDPRRIKWTVNLEASARRGAPLAHDPSRVVTASYRPFCRQVLYYDKALNERPSLHAQYFPDTTGHGSNYGIYMTAPGSDRPFAALMVDSHPDLAYWGSSGGQFTPRWRYDTPPEPTPNAQSEPISVFDQPSAEPARVDNIADETLADFQSTYGESVTKDDVFFYVYALLHSPEYRDRYSADLNLALPRILKSKHFQQFSKAGRELAELHLSYETVEPHPLDDPSLDPGFAGTLRVEKMRYGKTEEKKEDRTTIIVNPSLTLSGIPAEAHRYMLGQRSAVDWLIDQYQVKTDTSSGIVNDPNAWCDEAGDLRYIVDLVKRIVTVSLETMRIVDGLPALEIIE